jgi:hypothetical protein
VKECPRISQIKKQKLGGCMSANFRAGARIVLGLVGLLWVSFGHAVDTAKGKIVFTQGHVSPSCRTVMHRENGTGTTRYFRMEGVTGDDDVSSIVLTALMSNRDVVITYVPGETSGCGTEPRITYVTVF